MNIDLRQIEKYLDKMCVNKWFNIRSNYKMFNPMVVKLHEAAFNSNSSMFY